MCNAGMKVAVISDIHSNLPALNAVLDDMPVVDLIICAGDIVGYYPDANEVCSLLRELNSRTVRGNHDAYVLNELEPVMENRATYKTDWTYSNLSENNFKWLASLPVEIEISLGGRTIKIRHASPWDEETYLYPDSQFLAKIVPEQNETLIFGHTHHPMQIIHNKGSIINPGSIGQPRDWNPKASYAILDCESGMAEFFRISYDVKKMQERLKHRGWNESTISILGRVKNDE